MAEELVAGTIVDHPKFGKGVVANVSLTSYEVYFEIGGKYEFSKAYDELTVLSRPDQTEDRDDRFSIKEIEELITYVLDKYNALPARVLLGKKWQGGTLILQPPVGSLKPKDIPIEIFFHKIVMLRDRLRVLEQKINSSKVLTDEEKVDWQQYITAIYGSLTTFNILFEDRDDYFIGNTAK
ncbi:MAG: hypothetical protein KKA07_06580 [Bacteroidetes bacterium]|nr:hypothetical protein [Bacteroidota bacterium]MBU1718722.1 hypothetical protein [Bacteroidota bacterium]